MKMRSLFGLVLLLALGAPVLPLGAQSFEFDLDHRNRVRIGLKGIEVNYGRDH